MLRLLDEHRDEMKARESSLKNFFANVDVALRQATRSQPAKWHPEEVELSTAITHCEDQVHAALCDSINTRGAMDAIQELIRRVNAYLLRRQETAAQGVPAQPLLLRKAAAFVTRILSVFGLVPASSDRLGFPAEGAAANSDGLGRYLDTLSAFRDEVRSMARSKAEAGVVLAACDRLRDETLVDLGVRLEDR